MSDTDISATPTLGYELLGNYDARAVISPPGLVQATRGFAFADDDSNNSQLAFAVATASGLTEASLTPFTDTVTTAAGATPQDIAGRYGVFSFSRDDDTGRLRWTYTLNADADNVRALNLSDRVHDQLTVQVIDEDGNASTPLSALIILNGANDAPSIDPVADIIITNPGDGVPAQSVTVDFNSTDPDSNGGEGGTQPLRGYALAPSGQITNIAGPAHALTFTIIDDDGSGTVLASAVFNSLTGVLVVTANQQSLNALGVGESRSVELTVQATDAFGAMSAITEDSRFTLTLSGGTPTQTRIGLDVNTPITLDASLLDFGTVGNSGDLTYTIQSISGGSIGRSGASGTGDGGAGGASGGGASGTGASGSFTQAELEAGFITLTASGDGSVTVVATDAEGNELGSHTLSFTMRADQPLESAYSGVDFTAASDPTPLRVRTGLGENSITMGQGDDVIDTGLADDVIDLTQGGRDRITYRFAPTSASATDSGDNSGGASGTASGSGSASGTDSAGASGTGFVAWDGGDQITGFTPGEDVLVFSSHGDNAASADEVAEFIGGLGTAFVVKFDYVLSERGAGLALGDYDVTGLEIHFPQAVLLPGGKLAGSIMQIEFDTGLAWGDFSTQWLGGDAFDSARLELKANADGRAALEALLGVEVITDNSRPVQVGDEADNILDAGAASGSATGGLGGEASEASGASGTASGSGASRQSTVIFGAGGADTIILDSDTVANTSQEIIFRIDDDGTTITTIDGSDGIRHFALGSDRLRFVDIDEDTAPLTEVLGRFDGIDLIRDDTAFTGIRFIIDSNDTGAVDDAQVDDNSIVLLTFLQSLNADRLKARFGIIDDTAFVNVFDGGVVPMVAGNHALTSIGIGFVDVLFGNGDGGDELSVSPTLPAELI